MLHEIKQTQKTNLPISLTCGIQSSQIYLIEVESKTMIARGGESSFSFVRSMGSGDILGSMVMKIVNNTC